MKTLTIILASFLIWILAIVLRKPKKQAMPICHPEPVEGLKPIKE